MNAHDCRFDWGIRDDVLRLHPSLPPELPRRPSKSSTTGQPITVVLTRAQPRLRLHTRSGASSTVCVEDQMSVLAPGDEHVKALAPRAPLGHSVRTSGRASANSARS